MATTCQPLTYRRLQTQLQPNEELSHPSWGNHTCHDAQEAEIPRHALKQVTLTPGAAQCHQTWTWRLALMLCPTWMWPQYTLIRLGRSLPGPFSLWRGGRFSGQPPSFEQRQPWVFLSCGSQHIQSVYVINSMGGRARESVKRAASVLGSLGNGRKMPTISSTHIYIFTLTTTCYSCVQSCAAPCFHLPESSSSSDRALCTLRLDANCCVLSYPCTVKPV